MVVLPDGGFHGTIGGGTLEWRALAEAQRALQSGGDRARWIRQSLGPELGQCCGGRVTLLVEVIDATVAGPGARILPRWRPAAASPAAPSMSMAGSTGNGWSPMARRPEPTHIAADGVLIEAFRRNPPADTAVRRRPCRPGAGAGPGAAAVAGHLGRSAPRRLSRLACRPMPTASSRPRPWARSPRRRPAASC